MRTALLALSRNPSMRHFTESSSLGKRISRRFVAGLDLEDALAAVAAVNQLGMSATLDPLGENVDSQAAAEQAAATACGILDAISRRQVHSNLSVKLTQLGLDLGLELARRQLQSILDRAAHLQTFIRVDMEGADYTATTLALVEELHAGGANVGTVLQAYLHRTAADLERLVGKGIRLRLVKGAYREPAALALQDKAEVDANYVRLMQRLLDSGLYHAIATHDERIIEATVAYARQRHIAPDVFEFQMLYGIRRDLQQRLTREGWRVRIYIPFGPEWYPYFMRRLAERPANLLFLLKNLVK
ncbi:MAG TPA: proline dehydrogenase family protein [Terriglobales bacterium]|nr:proline dehydrogenase family protein [Terriglobales bacterium]